MKSIVTPPFHEVITHNTDNLIIQGDNLEALKALFPFYARQVKCIYIDPPYNTGSAFEHYDDKLDFRYFTNPKKQGV